MQRVLQRSLWLAAVLLLIGVLGAWLAHERLGRLGIGYVAQNRGLRVDFEELNARFGSVELRNVLIQLDGVASVRVLLESVEVQLSSSLALDRVDVRGGRIELDGTPDEVIRQVGDWRARYRGVGGEETAETPVAGRSTALDVRGLELEWANAFSEPSPQQASGIALLRDSGGAVTVSVSSAALGPSGARVKLSDLSTRVSRKDGQRGIEQLEVGSAEIGVRVDFQHVFSVLRGAMGLAAGPDAGAAGRGDDDNADLVPSTHTAIPRTVKSNGAVQVLRARFGEAMTHASRALLPGAHAQFSRFRVVLSDGVDAVGMGPGVFSLKREGEALALKFVPGAANSRNERTAPLAFDVRVPLGEGPIEGQVVGGPVSLNWLGIRDGDAGLVGTEGTMLRVDTKVSLSADRKWVTVDGSGALTSLSINQPKIAAETVRNINLSGDLAGRFSADRNAGEIERVRFDVNGVYLEGRAEFTRREGATRFDLQVDLPATGCQQLLVAVPVGMAPELQGFQLTGSVGFQLTVQYDSEDRSKTNSSLELENRCRIVRAPERFLTEQFRGPFDREIETEDGEYLALKMGPGTRQWYPLTRISPFLETAVVVSEDSRFFRHAGIDPKAVASAISDNLNARRFLRGASTITMQLAKNVFLTRTKTLSRKLQEALLTLLLEQELSKEEILELYLNVIEYGPDLYGIGPAARHYFDTTPDQLTLGQALYLGSILPRPSLSRFEQNGTLDAKWAAYLKRLMRISHRLKRITDEELEAGLLEQVTEMRGQLGVFQPTSDFDAAPSGWSAPPGSVEWPEETGLRDLAVPGRPPTSNVGSGSPATSPPF